MPAVETVNTLEDSQVDPLILEGISNAEVSAEDIIYTEDEKEAKYARILSDIDGEYIYSKLNLTEEYDALTSPEFAEMSWPFLYYSEIFDDDPETTSLSQQIKDSFVEHQTSTFVNQEVYEQHVVFKNILLNVKNIYILKQEGWTELTFDEISSLYQEQNKFYLAKIYTSERLKYSLNSIGGELYNKIIGISHHKHEIGYKYFIISSDIISFQDYLSRLPQNKSLEPTYYDGSGDLFDDLESFEALSYSFTSLKSNYVFQSTKANMSLIGAAEADALTSDTSEIDILSTVTTTGLTSGTGY